MAQPPLLLKELKNRTNEINDFHIRDFEFLKRGQAGRASTVEKEGNGPVSRNFEIDDSC
jgi:hypothetical protein